MIVFYCILYVLRSDSKTKFIVKCVGLVLFDTSANDEAFKFFKNRLFSLQL